MNKFHLTIESHEVSVANMRVYLVSLLKEMDQLNFKIKDLNKSIKTREAQIARAKREGKIGFNPDKFKID
jgi:hypothetical protein